MAGLVGRRITPALECQGRPRALHHRRRSLRGGSGDEWRDVDALAAAAPLRSTGAVDRGRAGWLRRRERWPDSPPRTGRVLERAPRARRRELDPAARPGDVSDATTCRARSDRGTHTG